MTTIINVRCKEELKNAIKNKEVTDIIAHGDLAVKLHTLMTLKKYSPWTIALLAASLAAIPLTGGLSAPAGLTVAIGSTTITLDGIGISAIILTTSFSLAMLKIVLFGFKPISFKRKGERSDTELHLTRNAVDHNKDNDEDVTPERI